MSLSAPWKTWGRGMSIAASKSVRWRHLKDTWIGEDLIQILQLFTQHQCIDDEVMVPGAELHQAYKSIERTVSVVFEVDSNFLDLPKLSQHDLELLRSRHPIERCFFEQRGRMRRRHLEQRRRV